MRSTATQTVKLLSFFTQLLLCHSSLPWIWLLQQQNHYGSRRGKSGLDFIIVLSVKAYKRILLSFKCDEYSLHFRLLLLSFASKKWIILHFRIGNKSSAPFGFCVFLTSQKDERQKARVGRSSDQHVELKIAFSPSQTRWHTRAAQPHFLYICWYLIDFDGARMSLSSAPLSRGADWRLKGLLKRYMQ